MTQGPIVVGRLQYNVGVEYVHCCIHKFSLGLQCITTKPTVETLFKYQKVITA